MKTTQFETGLFIANIRIRIFFGKVRMGKGSHMKSFWLISGSLWYHNLLVCSLADWFSEHVNHLSDLSFFVVDTQPTC